MLAIPSQPTRKRDALIEKRVNNRLAPFRLTPAEWNALDRNDLRRDARKAIVQVKAEYPYLTIFGFMSDVDDPATRANARAPMLCDDFIEQVAAARQFINFTYLENHDSLALKLGAERFCEAEGVEIDISHGALITAAIWAGYKAQLFPGTRKCTFFCRNGKRNSPD
jgi:hypothetical protein